MAYGKRELEGVATLADIEALPEGVVGEIIDGTLYAHARPGGGHVYFGLRLFGELDAPFQLGNPGPGGWWLMVEPGIQVPGSPEFVPDLAGWRRSRVPTLPERQWTTPPDWVCEILSPSTRAYDRRIKRPFYARIGVQHLWFIDLEERTLSIHQQSAGRWLELGIYGEGDTLIRAAPFEDIELRLGWLWRSVQQSA
ncbi:Uma2 family endonuclease [Myxococcus stipitatus]|uniref:Uma2 family endonuclease n=1 Tax=Myxococcus stipitatus TaxID=83455 RepID=UPI001F2D9C50|nr:Uma2 family endonuclease [Myxococcus stipitatus]MCE9670640.1 Uma2 family endonuclease [Myxococcus stipitatus]